MIEELLKQRMGMNVESVGRGKFEADLAKRMAACGVSDPLAYERLLLSSTEEFDALVSLLTVSETWFFRAYDSFIFLEDYIRSCWIPSLAGGSRRLRALSAPCSTGEEPYSMAMTFLRCGLPQQSFLIDAYDINAGNIERALKGVYTKNSFRSELQWFKPLHFKEESGRFALDEAVKSCVSFKAGNLFALPPQEEPYDIVFCRNLLIYFDEESQRKALDILTGLLKEGGILFLGHAESTSLLFGRPFDPIQAKGSFAFKKIKPKDALAQWSPTDTQRLLKVFRGSSAPPPVKPAVPMARPAPKPAPKPVARQLPPRQLSPGEEPALRLADAKRLADKGHLKEAAELCRLHIAQCKLDPEGYFLLGVILMSLKLEREAENFLNKAIFLKPDHFEALLSIAALKERRGDLKGAELCRRRAGREKEGALK